MKTKKPQQWVVADFETKTKEFYDENGYTEVWLWAISSCDGEIIAHGETLEGFMGFISKYNNFIIYFHNLKFDGMFILDYLLNNGFEYEEKSTYLSHKKYNILMTDLGQLYQIEIHFSRSHKVLIQDSLKLLPFKVSKIADDFGFEIKKLNIDYNDYTIDADRLEYVFHDVQIVALALKELKNEGLENMTIASCAYHNYTSNIMATPFFYPQLDDDFLEEWRESYRGGRCQVNPMYASAILHNVYRYDINSMYPYVMYSMPLPYGEPIPISKRGQFKFELYKVVIRFKLKENHMPTLLKKHKGFNSTSYYEEFDGKEYLYISNIDYELLEKHYNIEHVEFVEMYGFRTTSRLFRDYIDKWYAIKQNTKGAKRAIAKLMLNSLYGKFGSNFKGRMKVPYLNEDKVLSFKNTEEKEMRRYYLPTAIAITSWAHKLIDDAICNVGYENFVYCDTDSVHCLKPLDDIYVDQKELGKFKLETIEITARYIRAKTYCISEFDDNHNITYAITCSGMNQDCKDFAIDTYGDNIFDVFKVGLKIEAKKLLPSVVKGGVVLCPTTFEIKP